MKRKRKRGSDVKKLVHRMAKLVLRPEDLIVLQTDLVLDAKEVKALRKCADEMFKPYRTTILTAGMKLGVLRKEMP